MQKKRLPLGKYLNKADSVVVIFTLYSRRARDFGELLPLAERIRVLNGTNSAPVYLRLASPDRPLAPDTVDEIRREVLSDSFRLVSMGWSGAPQFLLTRQESRWDAAWAIRNDHQTGTEQLWRCTPEIAFPVGADTGDVVRLGSTYSIVIAGPIDTGKRIVVYRERTVLSLPLLDLPSVRDRIRFPGSDGCRSLVVNIGLAPDFSVNELFETAREIFRLVSNGAGTPRLVDFDKALLDAEDLELADRVPALPEGAQTPVFLAHRASEARRCRSNGVAPGERSERVLRILGAPTDRDDKAAGDHDFFTAEDPFTYLGSMAGEACLQTDDMRACTRGGRICEISKGNRTILKAQRVQGYARTSTQTRYLEMVSAAGCNVNAVHGVVEIASMATNFGSVSCITNVFLAENYPAVIIRMDAAFPAIESEAIVDDFSLFRLLIADSVEQTDEEGITSWYSDGSRRSWPIPADTGSYPMGGATIRFATGGRVLTIASLGGMFCFEIQIVRGQGQKRVYVHPFLSGQNIDLSCFSGYRFRATIAIGEEIAPEGAAFSAPYALRDSIYPYSFQPAGRISPE